MHTNGVYFCPPSGHLERERVLKGSGETSEEKQVESSRDMGVPLHSHHNFPFPITPKPQEAVNGEGKGGGTRILIVLRSLLKLRKKL